MLPDSSLASCCGREQNKKNIVYALVFTKSKSTSSEGYRELRGEMTTPHAPIAVTSVGASEVWDRERRTRVHP